MWYASPGNQGWGSEPASRKPSIMEADLGTLSSTTGSIKRSAGRVIRIINNLDHAVQVSIIYNCEINYPWTKPGSGDSLYTLRENICWACQKFVIEITCDSAVIYFTIIFACFLSVFFWPNIKHILKDKVIFLIPPLGFGMFSSALHFDIEKL